MLFPVQESSAGLELSISPDKTSNITKMDTAEDIKHVTKGSLV